MPRDTPFCARAPKARFSELFRLARECGPQRVTKHGKTAVVVLPAEEYERLSRAKKHQGAWSGFSRIRRWLVRAFNWIVNGISEE